MSTPRDITFSELVVMSHEDPVAFRSTDQATRLRAIKTYYQTEWNRIRERHRAGGSGRYVVSQLTAVADRLVRGVIAFGIGQSPRGDRLRKRIALCALGGYGRGELNPYSDLDLCLLYTGRLDADLKALNEYLVPIFWDVGFKVGYVLQSAREAVSLAASDPEVITSYLSARLLYGDAKLFEKLGAGIRQVREKQKKSLMAFLRARLTTGAQLRASQDLYDPEPDIKENVGGLRDYHVATWLVAVAGISLTLDDLERLGELRAEDNRPFQEGLDCIWRIRNELHFHQQNANDRLGFAQQRHVARALGYEGDPKQAIDRFMQDYYNAARALRRMLQIVIGITDPESGDAAERVALSRRRLEVNKGELSIGGHDPQWFTEHPPRLMEVIWECARQKAPLDHVSREAVKKNLFLVDDEFRRNDLVRRFFVAICSRPLQAGLALRQAAETGLLGAYIPEFQEIAGVVRYEDFHSYPVDEHTLRAIEALARLPEVEGPIGRLLQVTLEHMHEPHILVVAILLHDLGKAGGEEHVEEGVRLAKAICARIGLPDDDADRIVFLVEQHMLMNHIAMYRDTDDLDIITSFAQTMRTAERLRALLLHSYADLSAVGPNVWTEWKGALLAKLYLKAEQILLGRALVEDEYWSLPKASAVEAATVPALKSAVTEHLKQLGARYFVAFSPEQIAQHLECLEEARETGLAVRRTNHADTGTTDIVVCTRNEIGLFANIAGSFMSQLVDVQRAAVFTAANDYVVDSFTVMDAKNRRPLTDRQFEAFQTVLRSVLVERKPIEEYVARSRNRLFALHQPRIPVPTRITFDNDASRTDTVVDIETGDRTGLLYDIACAFARHGVDLLSSHIVTDARQVRDSFYVRSGHSKIDDPVVQLTIRTELESGIRPLAASEV